MTIALVNAQGIQSSVANRTQTLTVSSFLGNVIVVCASVDTANVDPTSIGDSNSNSYTIVSRQDGVAGGGAAARMLIAWAPVGVTNASNVITVNWSNAAAGGGVVELIALQYSGLSTTSPLDAIANGTTLFGTVVTSSSFSTINASEVAVAYFRDSSGGFVWTPNGSLVSEEVPSFVSWDGCAADWITTTLQTGITLSGTLNNSGPNKSMVAATFQAASGGGPALTLMGQACL